MFHNLYLFLATAALHLSRRHLIPITKLTTINAHKVIETTTVVSPIPKPTTCSEAALSVAVASSLGQYRHHPASPAHYSDNSPFIEVDDEDDDEYSAYFPSGNQLVNRRERRA